MNSLKTLDPNGRPSGRFSEAPEALLERYARRVAARLADIALQTPPGVDERLRFAREQALARARDLRATSTPAVVAARSGMGVALGGGPSRWTRLAAVLPLVVLVAGLMLIVQRYDRAQIEAAADIDTAILSDNIPPDAYSDPGFVEFLKAPPQE